MLVNAYDINHKYTKCCYGRIAFDKGFFAFAQNDR